MVGKPPRKQRSSRFVVTEKVDIEKLPPFAGEYRSVMSCMSFVHLVKKHIQTSGRSYLLKNCTSVELSSTSMTLVQN